MKREINTKGTLKDCSVTNQQSSTVSYADELKQVHDYLLGEGVCSDCLSSISSLIEGVKKTQPNEIKGINDVYDKIVIAASSTDYEKSLAILNFGAEVARSFGDLRMESDFTSRIVSTCENNDDYRSALEAEKYFCYDKNQYFETSILLSHYINIVRLGVKMNAGDEIEKSLATMFSIVSSSSYNLGEVTGAITDLAEVCKKENKKQRSIMQRALDCCKFAFPDIQSSDQAFLDNMIQEWA